MATNKSRSAAAASAARRVVDEPAFVLHRYDWSESSLILDLFTRDHGRVSLVAKGAKKPTSNFRPVLLPLQPLAVSYSQPAQGDGDVHTLKEARWLGGHVMPTGDALLSGLYLNELLMRLTARGDAHPDLFVVYANVVQVLASEHGDALEPVLRSFEMLLLQSLGLLPALDAQTLTLAPLRPDARYVLVPEGGLRLASGQDRVHLAGYQWISLHQALQSDASHVATLRACVPVYAELKPQLRALLQYHCGSPTLRTRQLMMDLQSL